MGLASGLVPVSELSSNSTSPVPFDYCVVPGTQDYAGQLVSAFTDDQDWRVGMVGGTRLAAALWMTLHQHDVHTIEDAVLLHEAPWCKKTDV